MKLDFPIIAKLGGVSNVQEKLQKTGYKITQAGISQWKKRGIPGPAVVALMKIAEGEGKPVDSDDLTLGGKPERHESGLSASPMYR